MYIHIIINQDNLRLMDKMEKLIRNKMANVNSTKAKKALIVSPLTKLLQLTTTCIQRNKYVVNTDLEDSCPTYF